jgi:hypothetical protein
MKKSLIMSGVLSVLFGCGGSGGGSDVPPTTPGESIVTDATQRVVAENAGGGFRPAPPAGSTCAAGAVKYTLTIATRTVDYTRCVGDGVAPYMPKTGSKTLTAAEYATVTPALDALKVVKSDGGCVADAPFLYLTVATATAEQKYVDDLDSCSVTGLPLVARTALQNLLDKLAPLTP